MTLDPTPRLYHYNAMAVANYDGDTITVDVDLGMGVWMHGEKVRIFGINCPELHKGDNRVAGAKAKDALAALVLGKTIVLETIKDGHEKYGRWLAKVWVKVGADWLDVGAEMIRLGHAVPFMGDA